MSITHRTTAAAMTTVIMAWTSSAFAVEIQCAQDEATDGLFCFAPTELREKNGIRSAPLYTGGPNAIRKSGFTVAANCATGVLHLKDRDGVSFAGAGPGEGTKQSRDLRRQVCDAQLPTAKKK